MKALREGDKFISKDFIKEARSKTFYELILFIVGYCFMSLTVVMMGYYQ